MVSSRISHALTLLMLIISCACTRVTADPSPPSIGGFQSPPIIYANRYDYINATIVDDSRDFQNATLGLSNGIILKWEPNGGEGTFSIHEDPGNYCTLDPGSSKSIILNDTALQLSWRVKLHWTYPENPVDILAEGTMVYDGDGLSSSSSHSHLFTFEDDLVIAALIIDAEAPPINGDDPENQIDHSYIVSNLPIPPGYEVVSAQAAIYNEVSGVLHVWYGLKEEGKGEESNVIFYTNTTDLLTWSDPLIVIDLELDGIRDPTIYLQDGWIYLFCQCYNHSTGRYHPIRLYRTEKASDFSNPINYDYLGDVIDLGVSGEFDDTWVASFCITKINDIYHGVYEALNSGGIFSMGRTTTTDIEDLPYAKDGQVRNEGNLVLYNPQGEFNPIVPDTFAAYDTLYIHYYQVVPDFYWQTRHLHGNFSENQLQLSASDFQPLDTYLQHNNIAHIGWRNKRYLFLMQSWNHSVDDRRLRLYMSRLVTRPGSNLTFKGIAYYEGTEIPPEDPSGAQVLIKLGEATIGTTSIDSMGHFTISDIHSENEYGSYTYTVYASTDEISSNKKLAEVLVTHFSVVGWAETIDKDVPTWPNNRALGYLLAFTLLVAAVGIIFKVNS